MTDKSEAITPSTYDSSQTNPKVAQWLKDYQIYNQDRQPFNPSKLIVDGPEAESLEDLDEKNFNRVFFQTMAQGVALDDTNQPHFFHPKLFLQDTNRRVFKPKTNPPTPYSYFANGLNSIVLFKNLPENQNNPTLQQEAKNAIMEYLDPKLFVANFTYDDDLFEIFQLLNLESLEDDMIIDCFNTAAHQKQELDHANREKSIERAQKTDYQHTYEPTPNPGSFKIKPSTTTINDILDKLKDSPNQVAFDHISALKKWGDFIQENIKDCHYVEDVTSFSTNPNHHKHYSHYSNEDTYAVIAFDFAGHRCMIAESCGRGGSNTVSASMIVWRGSLDDQEGWKQIFTKTKSEAVNNGLCKAIRHSDFIPNDSSNSTDIPAAEDLMFKSALHYFETGDLFGSGKQAAEKLDQLIGPQMWRSNSTSGPISNPQNNPAN